MRALGIVLIAACLVVDMATPLCPGAFRFDPAQSIEGVGARAVVALPPHVNAPPLPGHEPPGVASSRSRTSKRGDPVPRLRLRRRLPRAALASAPVDLGSPRSSEDG
jgi:hypothetical protein